MGVQPQSQTLRSLNLPPNMLKAQQSRKLAGLLAGDLKQGAKCR